MAEEVRVNGKIINYPETGDTNWGDEATDFAVQTSAAFGKLGLASGTSVDIAQTLDVTGNTTLDANLSVGGNSTLTGNLTVNGNTLLGNANTDTIGITGIVNVDSGVLYVDPVTNRVGINNTTPSEALDVTGNVAITGNETVGGTLGVTGNVSVNTNKFNITATSGNTTIAGTLGVTGASTFTGQALVSDGSVSAPGISFSSDTNTGIIRSASDQIDNVTGGVARSRIASTGQQSSTVPDLSGSNTTLYNEYKCRAWGNFNGTLTTPISPRANGNISSITKNGIGDYTVNFATAMPDVNYSAIATAQGTAVDGGTYVASVNSLGTNSFKIAVCRNDANLTIPTDRDTVLFAVFR